MTILEYCERERAAAYSHGNSYVEEWAVRLAEIACLQRLKELIDRLEYVHADPRYRSVWEMFMIHGGHYTEPKYGKEFEAAREALADLERSLAK